MNQLFWLFAALLVLAAVLRSELFFYLLYVLVGLQLVSRFWLRRSTRSLAWRRQCPPQAFLGEPVTVEVEVVNGGLLPLPWLALQESVAAPLRQPGLIREVVALGAGQRHQLRYQIVGQRRGYYRLGPLQLRSGDVLGLEERTEQSTEQSAITILPQLLPLAALGLPASLPFGTLASRERIFADPARPSGVRPYQPSDGVRRIDWKSSARIGQPQVRRYDPAIASETLIALAFSRAEYPSRYAYDAMERAVIAAAAIASQLQQLRQPLGLCSSGFDPASGQTLASLAVGRGREHLLQILAALGRLEPEQSQGLEALIWPAAAQLSWGSSLVLLSGQPTSELLPMLLGLRRRGLNLALIQIDASYADQGLAREHGIASYRVDRAGRPTQV